MVFSQCLFKTSYFIAILTRNRKNSSRTSKTIKLTQRQRSESAQRYLAFTLIPSPQIFSHFALYRHFAFCVMAVMPWFVSPPHHWRVCYISKKTQTLLRMTNFNLVVISDLGWVVAESNFLPSYVFLVVDIDLTISPHDASHPSLLSMLSVPGAESWSRGGTVIRAEVRNDGQGDHDFSWHCSKSSLYGVWTSGHS